MKKITRLTAIVMAISLTLLLAACSSTPCEHMFVTDRHSTYTQTLVEVKPASCTEYGYETWKCSCGAVYTMTLVMEDHSWSHAMVDENTGKSVKTCYGCGKVVEVDAE